MHIFQSLLTSSLGNIKYSPFSPTAHFRIYFFCISFGSYNNQVMVNGKSVQLVCSNFVFQIGRIHFQLPVVKLHTLLNTNHKHPLLSDLKLVGNKLASYVRTLRFNSQQGLEGILKDILLTASWQKNFNQENHSKTVH